MLEKELKVFYKERGRLLEENQGCGYVVIYGDTILGVWHDRTDAIREGLRKYGNVSMLVKDINDDINTTIYFSPNLIFKYQVINF